MFLRPRFRASFNVHVAASALFLLDEHHQFILDGERYCVLASVLDGKHTIGDIEQECKGRLALPQIFFILNELEKRGFLVEGENAEPDGRRAFSEYYRGGGPGTGLDTSHFTVSTQSVGRASAKPFAGALQGNGIATDASNARLLAVVTDDYLRPELDEINRACLRENRPWMLFKPVGMVLWIGPIFQPNETGCWSCLHQRLEANRQTERFIEDRKSSPGLVVTSHAASLASVELGSVLAATAVTEWLQFPDTARLRGRLITLDLAGPKLRQHTLVRRPQCPACGDPAVASKQALQPVVLSSQKKRFQEDGGHRTLTPEETFKRYEHHISPYLGAVTELVPAMGPWCELTPNFVAGHNFSMGLDSLVYLRETIRGVSGGKGVSTAQAKASALCEALERYSGRYHGDEHTRRGSFTDLKPEAIHPNECMGFSPEQIEMRNEWNANRTMGSRCLLISNPLDHDRVVDWSPLWSLTSNQFQYLPTAHCYYGHPEFAQGRWCFPDSNGTAAGNTLEEAILQGFFELVERDAVALWFYNRIKRCSVDIDSFRLPYLDAIREYYPSLGRELWVLDITSDLGISTFACISRRTDRPVEDILLGFGAHFDPNIALLRAVTEVNQFLPAVAARNPDGSTRYVFWDSLAQHWWTTARLEGHGYLAPDAAQPAIRLQDFSNPSSDDLFKDVQTCVDLCRLHKLDLLVLDQTRPDIGLSVVKVVAPQLNHFWRRLGKKRLYEVPVTMGWLNQPKRFEELNPESIFF